MLTVHHLCKSQSDRIVWLCEELEIPYRFLRYERDPVTMLAPPEYQALHPFGTAPTISDGDFVLGESGAIVEYVIARYGDGRLGVAADQPEFADYLYWLHFANGSMMPSEMIDFVFETLGDGGNPDLARNLRIRGPRAHDMIERRLGEAPWFAGGMFTAADIMMLFPLTTMRLLVPRDFSAFPNIRAYLGRIAARPGFQRAMRKADPDLVMPMD